MNVDPESMNREELIAFVADKMVKLSQEIAVALAVTSQDESHLLNGIDLACKGIRTLACEAFVEMQKRKGKA